MDVNDAGIGNGYPCFVISIAMIGVCTAVIGDVAGHLGCFIFLKDSVNAIAFVALGTSVPGRYKQIFSMSRFCFCIKSLKSKTLKASKKRPFMKEWVLFALYLVRATLVLQVLTVWESHINCVTMEIFIDLFLMP